MDKYFVQTFPKFGNCGVGDVKTGLAASFVDL